MARPCKQGLDYFPLDVHMDRNMQLFEAEFGLTGFAVYIKLLQMIYSEGYYIKWDEDAVILFVKSINSSVNEVTDIINGCIKRDLFSNSVYTDHKVLTSRGIQKRYFEACRSAKRKIVSMVSEYNLCGDIYNELYTELTRLTPEEMPQRKVEEIESKIKEKKISPLEIELLWKLYPKKEGKKVFVDKMPNLIKKYGFEQMENTIKRYVSSKGSSFKFFVHGSTFVNSGYVDYLDENFTNGKQALENFV